MTPTPEPTKKQYCKTCKEITVFIKADNLCLVCFLTTIPDTGKKILKSVNKQGVLF